MAEQKNQQNEIALNINLDTTPILYTDNILMSTNEDGIVFDVCQKLGVTNQMRVVSRIGMSRTHAKKFVKEMGRLLAMTEGQIRTGKKEN